FMISTRRAAIMHFYLAPADGSHALSVDVGCGSNSVVAVMAAARPLFLRKRKSIRDLAMSQECHNRTPALQQNPAYSITSSARARTVAGTSSQAPWPSSD